MKENVPETSEKPNKSYAFETAQVLSVAFELGFVIALPIVGLGYLGKWLDQKQGTHHFVYLGIVAAIVATTLIVYKRFEALITKLRTAAKLSKDSEDKDANLKEEIK